MGLELAIHNVGEYFSAHYLAGKDGFSKDIAEYAKSWKEQGSQSTPRKLQALGEAFYAAKSEAMDYPEPELRSRVDSKVLQSWHPQLMAALGYHPEPVAITLETEKKQLPALLRLHRHSQPWLVILQAPFCLSSGDTVEEALEEFVEPPTNSLPSNNHIEQLPTLITEWEKAIALLFKQEDRPRWAMLLAGSKIYLFDAHTYAQGRYLYVDLDAAFATKDKNAFDAISALLAHECLAPESESDDVLHEKLREGSLKSTHGVSEQLQAAVREAIELIANGWIEQRRAKNLGFRQLSEREAALPDGTREVTAEQLKHDALVYVYRILFCLYAEARGGELGILPITDDIYRLGYSLEALRDLADMGEPGTQSEDGSYYAEHLNRLFTLVHEGFHPEQEEENEAESSSTWKINLPEQNELFGSQSKQLTLDKAGRKQLATGNVKTFVIQPLTATLFAPDATPLLSRVLLSNRVLQQVIRRLSLGTGSNSRQIGRINYAELGILQLGSVYEGLLSYKGFFAKENLIQVLQKPKKPKNKPQPVVLDNAVDPKTPTWFVPETRQADFKTGEIVLEHRTQQPRIYKTGEFILHLNGVDRVNSASYYTPEVLTRCLISEALKERLKDFGPEQADEILKLTVCEPAMGSAAFLVEAIDQLARHYLQLKQEQIGQSIDPSQYEDELRRVRHYIAVHNVYGVDLNSTAVELGSLSLWLATIHRLKIAEGENGSPDLYQPGATPWFGLRLRAGNSLIGARRAVWTEDQLITGAFYGKDAAAPRQLKPGEQRKPGEIYHFLVWDEDMAPAARDKLMREYWPDECEAIKTWNNKQVKSNWRPEDIARARDICERIDVLWQDYAEHRIQGLKDTECTATVWPVPAESLEACKPSPSLAFQENLKANLEAQSGAFQRLKLLMDSWCSFYFWPLEAHSQLPSREAWLAAAEVLLGCDSVQHESTRAMLDVTLGKEIQLEALFQASQQQLPDAQKLADAVPWYGEARTIDGEQHFHHWELIFTEVMGPHANKIERKPRGFDLIFGNPPWIKIAWQDQHYVYELNPSLGVAGGGAEKIQKELKSILISDASADYVKSKTTTLGLSRFLSSASYYSSTSKANSNLYKSFIELSWMISSANGLSALLHPFDLYNEDGAEQAREKCYKRLRKLFHFRNEKKLFRDVNNKENYCICLYSGFDNNDIDFVSIFNLFSPKTIERSYDSIALKEEILGIKNNKGEWEERGNSSRIVRVDSEVLETIAAALGDENSLTVSMPQLHLVDYVDVLEKISNARAQSSEQKISDFYSTTLIGETEGKKSGLIALHENPSFKPSNAGEWVVIGPNYYVSTPFNKTPFTQVTSNKSYSAVDLTSIPGDYLPGSTYEIMDKSRLSKIDNFFPEITIPGYIPVDYRGRTNLNPNVFYRENGKYYLYVDDPSLSDADVLSVISQKGLCEQYVFDCLKDKVSYRALESGDALPKRWSEYYKYANRKRAQPTNERTLIPCLLPENSWHVISTYSITYFREIYSVLLVGVNSSLIMDFLVKLSGREDIIGSAVTNLPLPDRRVWPNIINRSLRLNCVSSHYERIWRQSFDESMISDGYSKRGAGNKRYELDYDELKPEWRKEFSLVTDYSRRIALLELDVLVAIGLNISCGELISIYKSQFPVFFGYENSDLYDSEGARLPSSFRKDAGAKELREALTNHDGKSPVTVTWEIDNGNQTVTKTFYPPFNHVDRIEDYKTAYRVFSERLGLNTSEQIA